MKSERQREAKELRAQGFEWAQLIQAKADRDRTVALSEAQRYAQITRGEGEAEASRILADSQKGDPSFYAFYRSLQSYRQALADSAPVLLLTPDAEFLKALKSGPPEPPREREINIPWMAPSPHPLLACCCKSCFSICC